MEHQVLGHCEGPLGRAHMRKVQHNYKSCQEISRNIVCGYNAQEGTRLFTSPLIIASKYPICESRDIKRRSAGLS